MSHVMSGAGAVLAFVSLANIGVAAEPVAPPWLWSTAHAVPKETTNQGSGYFSIVEGHNGRLYIGAAKYGVNAYLVEFDPQAQQFRVAVDSHQEIGTTTTGFAAQAKIHTRNNVGASGRIYFGTKQGYPEQGEERADYPGGYPLVYDPATGRTRVYPIPVPHQGLISIAPDESRGVAYLSTCSDERPIESTHFMRLDLATGKYRDLLDCRHMYAFIAVDHRGRAYHPILGGEIARYDPATDSLQRLTQTIDGRPLPAFDPETQQNPPAALLAHPESHPINWDISPDRRTLYAVAMSGNELFAYDLTAEGTTLPGRSLGKLIAEAEKTDCRALCVGPDGTVWAGVAAAFPGRGEWLHVVSWTPERGHGRPACGSPDHCPADAFDEQRSPTEVPTANTAPAVPQAARPRLRDHGPIAIRNPDYTTFTDAAGQPLPWHHGVHRPIEGGPLVPRYAIMGICAAKSGRVYVTTLAPFTLHELDMSGSR